MATAEDLPNNFDIIVLGTGLTETIAAAAFSRIGLKVLHLDRHDYYGGAYGNFNLEGIENWKQKNLDLVQGQEVSIEQDVAEDVTKLLEDGETAVRLPGERAQAFNIRSQYHIRERTAEEEAQVTAKKAKSRLHFNAFSSLSPPVLAPQREAEQSKEKGEQVSEDTKPAGSNLNTTPDTSTEGSSELEKSEGLQKADELSGQAELSSELSGMGLDECSDKMAPVEDNKKCEEKENESDSGIKTCSEDSSNMSNISEENADSKENENSSQADGKEQSMQDQDGSGKSQQSATSHWKEWTVGDIKDDGRRFCFDTSPRVLHCAGDLVELLIQSDVARYCEFRTVSRVLTMLKDSLQQVPCSRADVFSSKIVSLIEKRLMMKFLQFAAEFEKSPAEYQDYIGKPFIEFLKSKKLSATIQHFVQHAIAMVTDGVLTEDALKRTQKFLHSLGRYGNTAFLFPLYGTGELPQAFSRLSAVFGGIYCLTTSASHLLTDSSNKCCGIITSTGQHIKCSYLIAETTYLPESYVSTLSDRSVSRAIFITSSSVLPSDEPELSMLNYVCTENPGNPVTVLELPPSACVCPKLLYVIHLTRVSTGGDAEEDLREVREKLFAPENPREDERRPKILWSMYFQQEDRTQVSLSSAASQNVLVTSGGGDSQVDLDFCVAEAKQIFHTVCPGEEFLPKPPNPEDIIHVDDTDAAVASGPSEFEGSEDTEQGETNIQGTEQGETRAQDNEQGEANTQVQNVAADTSSGGQNVDSDP